MYGQYGAKLIRRQCVNLFLFIKLSRRCIPCEKKHSNSLTIVYQSLPLYNIIRRVYIFSVSIVLIIHGGLLMFQKTQFCKRSTTTWFYGYSTPARKHVAQQHHPDHSWSSDNGQRIRTHHGRQRTVPHSDSTLSVRHLPCSASPTGLSSTDATPSGQHNPRGGLHENIWYYHSIYGW